MPDDASTQMQVAHAMLYEPAPGAQQFRTVPIEMGGRGQVVELWGVNYIPHDMFVDNPLFQGIGLSLCSNPEYLREDGPPTGYNFIDWGDDPSVYARACWWFRRATAGTTFFEQWQWPQPIPMYGIIRPRRQVFLVGMNGFSIIKATVEVYYRPIHLSKDDQDAINRKYGKYRRS